MNTHRLRTLALIFAAVPCSMIDASAQLEVPEPTPVSAGLERIAGEDPGAHIKYVRLLLRGTLIEAATRKAPAQSVLSEPDISGPEMPGPGTSGHVDPPSKMLPSTLVVSASPLPAPTLTAQCTLGPSGKYLFELFADFGGITDRAFYPPWKPTTDQDLFPPRTQKVVMTMNFLGYTQVKPVRRQWEIPVATPGQYRYNTPGSSSSNMEDITFYLRFLLALPTLRLTLDHQTEDFLTTPLLDQLRKEPLCRAARL